MSDWFEDGSFWRDCGPHLFDGKRWERAVPEIDAAVEFLGLEAGAHVLDLCCGPGRHSLELARRGFAVTAVDLHEPYLAEARQKNTAVEWVHGDMRDFVRAQAFDGAINLFSSFGYFEDPADDRKVARHVHASLKPGARLLLDTMSKEVLASRYLRRRWHRTDDGTLFLEETEAADWREAHTTWTLIRDGKEEQHSFRHRLYSGTELEALLRDAGFCSVRLHGGLDGRPYGPGAERLYAVATK